MHANISEEVFINVDTSIATLALLVKIFFSLLIK